MNKRDKSLRKARKTNENNDRAIYRRLRIWCNNKIKKAKATFQKTTLTENIGNTQKFWKTIKSVFLNKTRNIKISGAGNVDKNSIVNNISNYFSTVVKTLKTAAMPLMNFAWRVSKKIVPRTDKLFKLDHVSVIFIEKELRSLKGSKATGIDELPPGLKD